MDFFIYLLKSTCILLMFMLVYYLLLKQDTHFHFKRFFILFGLLLTLLFPSFYYTKIQKIDSINRTINTIKTTTQNNNDLLLQSQHAVAKPLIDLVDVCLVFYFIIVSVLGVKLTFQYYKLYKSIYRSPYKQIQKYKVHDIKSQDHSFSFFNHIIIHVDGLSKEEYQMIMSHEKVHVDQWHSLDVLFCNIICTLLWFNPAIWFYRKTMLLNLENIADYSTIRKTKNKTKYQLLLLKESIPKEFQYTINNFFQPSIKQRIMMLNNPSQNQFTVLKSFIVLPLLLLFFVNFQSKIAAQENQTQQKINTLQNNVEPKKDIKNIRITNSNNKSSNNFKKIKTKEINKSNQDSSKSASQTKQDKIAIRIDKNANKEYLETTKIFLKKKYNIDVNYTNSTFNNNKELTGIKIEVNCNDGFKGSYVEKNDDPIKQIVFYRDYTQNTTNPFGIGTELPRSFTTTENGQTSTIFSSHKKETNENQYLHYNKVNGIVKNNSIDLKKVKTYILNDKKWDKRKLQSGMFLLEDFKITDDNIFIGKGKMFKELNFNEILKSNYGSEISLQFENLDVILFSKKTPKFFHIDELKIEDKN